MYPTHSPSHFSPETYTADDHVEVLHASWHWQQDDFDATDRRYQNSVAIIMAQVILVGFIFLCFAWSIRCSVRYRSCRTRCKICFMCNRDFLGNSVIILLFCIGSICATWSYYGYHRLTNSTRILSQVITKISSILLEMLSTCEDIQFEISLLGLTSRAGCNESDSSFYLDESIEQLERNADSVNDRLVGLPDYIEQGSEYIDTYFIDYVSWGIGGLTASLWVLTIFGIGSIICTARSESRRGDACCLFCLGFCGMAIMITLMGFETMCAVTIADFCVKNPDSAILSLVEEESSLDDDNVELVEFYTTCAGGNPMANELDSMTTEVRDMSSSAISNESTSCDPVSVENILLQLNATATYLEIFQEISACQPLQSLYAEGVYDHICRGVTLSLREIIFAQAASALFIWIALSCLPCVTYKYDDDDDNISLRHKRIYAAKDDNSESKTNEHRKCHDESVYYRPFNPLNL